MRVKTVTGCLLLGVLVLSACSPAAQTVSEAATPAQRETVTSQWPIVIDDSTLTVPDVAVTPVGGTERILALAVGSGELVELLGAGDQLIGRDEASATPEHVPVVTQAHQVDVEQALSLDPSVVLVDDLSGPPEAISALANSGARIVQVPAVWTLIDIPQRIRGIAEAVGADQQAAVELTQALTPITNSQGSTRVAFLYLRGPSAVYLLGGANTGADALIQAAGAVDVGAELGYDGFVPLTAEAIAQADPDVILVMSDGLKSVGGIEGLLELPGVSQTAAGQQGQVVVVDDRTLLSFGSKTPALVQSLARAFAAAA